MSDSMQGLTVGAPVACFRFQIDCTISKPQRLKGDYRVENPGQITRFLIPVKFRGGWTECLSQ